MGRGDPRAGRADADAIISNYLTTNPAVGMSVALAHKGTIYLRRGWGHANKAKGKTAHGDTVYRLASVSKAIAALIGYKLQSLEESDAHFIDLDRQTKSYETRLKAHHTHTLADLLAHRGQVGHYAELGGSAQSGEFKTAYAASKFFRDKPLVTSSVHYSTHAYTLLAAAYEAKTKMSFCGLLDRYISTPLDVPSLRCEKKSESVFHRSKIYRNTRPRTVTTRLNLSWKYAGGGLEASAVDLARLGIKIAKGKLLDSEVITQMTTPPDSLSNRAHGWDPGGHNGRRYFEKRGDLTGARALYRIYPADEIVVVLLTNTRAKPDTSSGSLRAPASALVDLLFD